MRSTDELLSLPVRRFRLVAPVVVGVAVTLGGCGLDGAREFVGIDTSHRPDICVVVAPAGLPPVELDAAVSAVVDDVAGAHGRLTGLVAVGPSAAAFPRIVFDAAANAGVFASDAGNKSSRDADADSWGLEASGQILIQIGTRRAAIGLDLFGGIRQCVRDLSGSNRMPTVVLISTGIHQTSDLDLADDKVDAATVIPDVVAGIIPPDTRLVLHGIGRVDPEATGGAVARRVIEPVIAGWDELCRRLAERCTRIKEG